MTKRKRDIFTVIESINNWFEASELNTTTSDGPEGHTNHPITTQGSSNSLTVGDLGAGTSRPADHLGPSAKASHVANSPNGTGIGPGPRPEVAEPLITAPEALYPPATEEEHVPANGDRDEGPQPAGYRPGTEERTGSGPGAEEERELTIAAFWRLLADAGYDVW